MKHNYLFTDRKRSMKGIFSTLYFVLSLVLIIAAVYISYKEKGNGGGVVGVLGVGSFIISAVGFFVGINSFKEDDVFYKYPWIGTVGNAFVGIIIILMILVGL